jgi:hypothetical protein
VSSRSNAQSAHKSTPVHYTFELTLFELSLENSSKFIFSNKKILEKKSGMVHGKIEKYNKIINV